MNRQIGLITLRRPGPWSAVPILLAVLLWFAAGPAAGQAEPLAEAETLARQVERLHREGRYAEAEPLARRAVAIHEATVGPADPRTAASLYRLAVVLKARGGYAEAEALQRRELEVSETAYGPAHPETAASLGNLAELLREQGRLTEAEPLYRRALAIRETALGAQHPSIAIGLNDLALLLQDAGRYGEAEPAYRRALAIGEAALGPEHAHTAAVIDNLGALLQLQGRYTEAEPLHRRALAIREKTLGPEHDDTATSLGHLALLLKVQGRHAEAEPPYRHAIAIGEAALGPDHPQVATALNNLAMLLQEQEHADEAEPLHRRALAIRERALGAAHPQVAQSLGNLGGLLRRLERHVEAEPMLRRALAINEAALGPGHPDTATRLGALAALLHDLERFAEAETLYRRAIAVNEAALGSGHPDLATSLNELADLLQQLDRNAEAIAASRRAAGILAARFARPDTDRTGGHTVEQRYRRFSFLQLIGLLADEQDRTGAAAATIDEAFRMAQLAGGSEAARAVAGMATRFAAGGDALAATVRERQELLERWRLLEQAALKAQSTPPDRRNPQAEDRARQARDDADNRLRTLDARIAAEFPRYAEIADPRPLTLAEAQALLADDEALLAWTVSPDESFVFALRKHRASFARIELEADDLKEAVAVLRSGLQPPEAMGGFDRLPGFDVSAAHRLYRQLFAPVEVTVADARHVLVVPDGALQSLPLGVLVTREPQAPIGDVQGYADVPWLARRQALTVLPAVSSLRALRLFAAQAKATSPFAGFGDPLFEGVPGQARAVRLARLFRGGLADVQAVRELARLPDTAGELQAQARALRAPDSAIRLGALASETGVKRADLRGVRVLSFATHGLISGELGGLAEPALALTPPAVASAEDDGLLTASEVAQLQLDADWVVLSACNTAAGDGGDGAEGLSGLAKAFFHAGARSLLVSHWPVETTAAVALTTGAFQALEREPGIGRAEALQRSMLALIEQARSGPKTAHLAHPMFWAPFVLVGEGAAGR